MMPATQSKPLSAKEAAQRIGISTAAGYELCNAGLIAYRRVGVKGGRIRFEEADVEAYLAATHVAVAPAVPMPKTRNSRRKPPTGTSHGFAILPAGGWSGKSRLSS